MTDEKKNGETTKPVEEKKEKTEEKGKVTDKKVEAKEIVKEEKTAKEPEKGKIKEEKKPEAPEEKVETKPVEENTDKKEAEEAAPEKKTIKKHLGNLNFYPELRTDLPELRSGDALKIFYRVVEGGKERIQLFEGTIIAIKNSGIAKTITVRKTSFGISIERIFPLNSKLVQKIEVIKRSRVRRAKLYYLRKLKGKAARLKELR